ncbi:MAG: glycosyltransferase, partial [Elainellaceae cyanobacterium]
MAKLSLCMIVKDEAVNLSKCLDSVRSVVDELIVVDTGSTDETIAIAQSYGATIQSISWNHDFAAARNAALQFVTGDWVLVLDADERLVDGIGKNLRQAIANENCLVVNLVRQEIGATQSPYSLVSRLFRRHPDLQFRRPYHAMIDDSVLEVLQREPNWIIEELQETAILHEGYRAEAIANRNKAHSARLAMERFLTQHPGDPYVCSKLGALYLDLERPTYGIELLERGLKTENLDPPVAYELHYHLGIAYNKMRCVAQAAYHYQQAIQQPLLSVLKLGAYNNLGNLQQVLGDQQGALTTFETVLSIDPTFTTGHYNLGMALKAQGKLLEAIAHYNEAIRLQPDY